jgi:hypothetical protein
MIEKALHNLEIGSSKTVGNLSVTPLLGKLEGKPDYLTLSQALDGKLASVKEVSEVREPG